jgi:hypothetical protein
MVAGAIYDDVLVRDGPTWQAWQARPWLAGRAWQVESVPGEGGG